MSRYKQIECNLCNEDGSCEYCDGNGVIGGIELKQTFYTVLEGDTWVSIAELFYGKSSDYIYVRNANKNKTLLPGEKLFIPTTYEEKARYID